MLLHPQQPHQLPLHDENPSTASNNNNNNPRRNPLAIPEILLLVSQHFDHHSKHTLFRSLLVCRQWYHLFLPKLWSSLTLQQDESYLPPPDPTSFRKHAPLIHHLELQVSESLHDLFPNPSTITTSSPLITFPNLSSLIIDSYFVCKMHDDQYEQSLVAFLHRHAATLQHLTAGHLRLDPLLLNTLAQCLPLKSLHLHVQTLQATPDQWIESFDPLWSHIHTLKYSGPPFRLFAASSDLDTFKTKLEQNCGQTALKELCISLRNPNPHTIWLFLWIIMKSPRLTRLQWDVPERQHRDSHMYFAGPTLWLTMAATTGCLECPRLTDLTFCGSHIQIQDFKVILETLTSVQRLDLHLSNFGQGHGQVLIQEIPWCRTTLTFLDLTKCKMLEHETTVHDLLCNLSGLETFRAPCRSSRFDPRPWVCLGMKDLTLDSLPLEPEILGRLATLKRLELWNGCPFFIPSKPSDVALLLLPLRGEGPIIDIDIFEGLEHNIEELEYWRFFYGD